MIMQKDSADVRGEPSTINLTLPDGGVTVVQRTSVRHLGPATIWHGTVPGQSFGHATIITTPHGTRGLLQLSGKRFKIVGGHVEPLAEPSESEARPLRSVHDGASAAGAPEVHDEYVITVLLVLPKSDPRCSDAIELGALAAEATASLDDVWATAGGPKTTASVPTYCADLTPSGDIYKDLNAVEDSAELKTARADTMANFVAFLVPSGSGCGVSSAVNYPIEQADPGDAYAVVKESCAFDNFSLAHELGHLMGMDHDRFTVGGGDASQCNYGYVKIDGDKSFRDVMSYKGYCDDQKVTCPRMGFFSAPPASGIACGGTQAADNVSVFLHSVPYVVKFH